MLGAVQRLATFSLALKGFQEHKEEILMLAEETVRVQRGQILTPAAIAQKYVRLNAKDMSNVFPMTSESMDVVESPSLL